MEKVTKRAVTKKAVTKRAVTKNMQILKEKGKSQQKENNQTKSQKNQSK
jgi:hypothetical protein